VQILETRVQRLERQVADLEARRPVSAGPVAKAKEPPKALPTSKAEYLSPAPTAAPAEADKVFAEGMRLYKAKKYTEARAKFSRYLKEQAKGAKAQEAKYYLADSFYKEGNYQQAALEFHRMAGQFPKSVLAPAALLRQALSYQKLQQTGSYHQTLNKLIKSYPKSPEAKEAAKWLKQDGKEAPAKPALKPPAKPAKAVDKPE
jgi:tol-pal system protein YbgF